MSDGDRGKRSKAGLIWGIAVAVAFSMLWIGYGLLESTKYEWQADDNRRNYSEYTRDKVAQACVGIAPREKAVCLADAEDKQREYEANQSDLVAQRQSALWAYIMGAAAVIGMGLSAVGVFLVWTTFRETQRTAQISFDNLKAYRETERGHCEIVLLDGSQSATSNLIHYKAHIKNFGRSPVKILEIRYQELAKSEEPPSYRGATFEEFVIGPNETSNPAALVRGDNSIKRFPYIGGYLEYRCKFGEYHRSYFCYLVQEAPDDPGIIRSYTHWVHECKRERDWPADT